ncbi:MAG: glycoside hydrolase family 3 C-terminal domain-containing protein [Planctomycetes bacterium]|nr:glycoside hydrolase family 3 C-terminal domain-containing protein [Planctomycetota bacterium]
MAKKISIFAAVFMTVLLSHSSASGNELKVLESIASSVENDSHEFVQGRAVDGNMRTRWASKASDPQWICFDFGSSKSFNLIIIDWESAYGKIYEIQISNDASSWKTIFKEENGDGGRDVIPFTLLQESRYVRMYGIQRGTGWGYSIHEFKVCMVDSVAPLSPSDLTSLTGDGVAVLKWSDNTESDLAGYNIYRSEKSETHYEKINQELIKRTKYTDKGIANGTSYYYYIKAVDLFDREGKSSEKISVVSSPVKRKGSYLDTNLSIEERANDLLSRMTLEEKVEQLSGLRKEHKGFDYMTTYSNERLGIPPIKCSDGPHGVTKSKTATAFPVSMATASSWEPELMEKIGVAIAKECIAEGRIQSLGPCLNICRNPRHGRTHEGYGEDPYLVAKMAVASVKGIQSQKVIATPKHFACNNIEIGRGGGPVEIDERTLREIYLPAFKACIKEGNAWSVMGAYNKVNGEYCCGNKHLLKDILKDEWGFKGFVITDWGGCHSTIESITAGLDLEMPETNFYGNQLVEAVKKGKVSEEVLDDSVRRILKAKFWAGLFDEPQKRNTDVVDSKEHIALALEVARKSIVLLKNKKSILPLDKNKIKTIAVLGPNANITTSGEGLGSGQVFPPYLITPLEAIKNKIGDKVKITGKPEEAEAVILIVGLAESIAGRVEGEGTDREFLHLTGDQDELIKETCLKNKNTIVVLISGSAITMDKWIDKVPAVIMAFYPGQEGGNAIADVLFGDYNPGGKLPITFPESMAQLRPLDWNYKDEWKAGIGYHYYDKKGIRPLFPFGYGISYTEFKYSNLKVVPDKSGNGNINISADLENTGEREGDEVVQLYLQDVESSVERPVKTLKGFKRITLNSKETKTVNFILTPDDLAYYNKDMEYVVEPGTFKVMIGSSSRDIRLKGSFEIK